MQNRRYFFTFIFVACLGPQLLMSQPPAGWFKQYTFPAEYRIRAITFVDSATGWAAGWKRSPNGNPAGVIVHTADAGRSWREQLIDATYSWFNDMTFLDKKHGWAVGLGILYKTVDGGDNWIEIQDSLFRFQPLGISGLGDMQSVSFSNLQAGIISGELGTLATTQDGGTTWKSTRLVPEGMGYIDTLHYVVILNPDTACAVGVNGIAVTTNGGENWRITHFEEQRNYRKCVFINDRTGWTLSLDSQILRTNEAGQTWEDLGRIYEDRYTLALDIEFVDALTGWVITSGGIVWKTNDGGLTWEQQTINSQIALTTVDFVTPQIGFLADHAGNIYRTVTGGTVGVKERNPPSPRRYALFSNFPNPFNPETALKFTLPKKEKVILEIFTLAGQKVKTLLAEERIAGEHLVHWDGANARGEKMPSGVYFAVLKAGSQIRMQKMALIR